MQRALATAVRYFLYPLLLAATLLIIHGAVTGAWDLKRALWGYLFGLIVVLIAVERLLPLSADWSMTRASLLRDLKYLGASGIAIALVRTGFGTLAIWFSERHQGPLAHTAIVPSVAIFLMLFELLQYWLHRLSHEGRGALGRFLWNRSEDRIGLRRIPMRGRRRPAFDLCPERRIVDPQLEGVKAVDDLVHQRPHLLVVDPGNLGPGDAVAVAILDNDVAAVAGARDRHPTGMQVFQPGVAHADHRHQPCELRGNPLFVVGSHGSRLRPDDPCGQNATRDLRS